jgi:hypothetical protein
MNAQLQSRRRPVTQLQQALLLVAVLSMSVGHRAVAIEPTDPPDDTDPSAIAIAPPHLSEEVRASVKKLIVLPGTGPIDEATTGSYEKQTAGLYGGAEKGSRAGRGVGTEIGPVSMRIPIPILTIPGAIVGGIAGKTQRAIQDFRDRLTEDLEKAENQSLSSDALASDVFWSLRRLPKLDSRIFALTTPIPEDTDAVLYVGIEGITIDVQEKDAVISTTATATLRRLSDGVHLYEEKVSYEDRDTLANWTANGNALWHSYANYARHYLGREISAKAFDRVNLKHELMPVESANVKRVKRNNWRGVSKSSTPTLAWELKLAGGDNYGEWTKEIDPSRIAYDVEIYDMQRLVYAAKDVPQASHMVEEELPCKPLRWSVRPYYRVAEGRKFGEWMRLGPPGQNSKANVGRRASEAPAYIQDFATLTLKCKRR